MATQPDFGPVDPQSAGSEAMPDSELISLLAQHEAQSIGYEPGGDDEISAAQQQALNYYNGIMDDVPAAEGSSSVVDSTVAVVVDNALAAVLKPFVSSDETVAFSPRGPEDVAAAEQATEYVNYILHCDNPGFLILHDWFKDALLTKLGVVKVWWEDTSRMEMQPVQLTDDMQAAYIRSQPEYQGEENGVAYVGQMVADGRVKIVPVPPEEFRISRMSRDVETSPYLAHAPANVTRSDLVEMGFDAELVESLPAWSGTPSDSATRDARYADENITDSSLGAPHKSQDVMALRDEYIRVDRNGDGVAELVHVMRVDDVALLIEEVEEAPFSTLCPIPMPHKVIGASLADRSIQEQKIGTVLWRQTLDNLYKSNNPRPIVGDGAWKDDGSTADSLGDNAPGAAIYVRDRMQFDYGAVPFTADKSFIAMEVLDKKVEEKTGISLAGQGLDTNSLKASGQMTATEVSQIASGKNARTEMIARIFAETGVKRLFRIILKLVAEHQPKTRMIRLRNQWVEMDPRGWPDMDLEISVGLGVGEKFEQIAQADAVLETMAQLAQTPFAPLITIDKVYNAVKRKFTAAGIKNTDDFLNPPDQIAEQPQQPSPEEQKAAAELQLKQAQMQSDQQMQAFKLDAQREEASLKIQLAREEMMAKHQLAREKAEFEAQLAVEKMNREYALAANKLERESELAAKKAEREASMSQNRPGGDLDK